MDHRRRSAFLAGIQARLAFVLVIASLPALAIFGSYAAYRFQEEKLIAMQQLQQEAQSIAATRGVVLDQIEALLRSLAGLPQLRNMRVDPRACSQLLASSLRGSAQYTNIVAADMEGRVLCRGIEVAPPQPANVANQAWFQRVVARHDFVVGEYAIGRRSGQRAVHTAFPIIDDNGDMIGAVGAGVHLSWLSERFAALNPPKGLVVALLDADGTILIRHPQPEHFVGRKAPEEATRLIAEQGRGSTEWQMLDGVIRVLAYEPLGGIRWNGLTVLVAAEQSYLLAPVRRLIAMQAATFAVVLVLGVLAAVLGAYWMVVRPVRLLERTVDAFASGDRSARAIGNLGAHGEIGRLETAFNAMAETLSRQEAALRKASAQKSRYLAIASHDLRQPLQITMMGLEAGIMNTEGKTRANLERAQRGAERLQAEFDVLADVVRADMAGMEAGSSIRAVSVSWLLERIGEAHRQAAAAKGLGFHIIRSRLVVASGPEALFTIVNNLVMNAVNYTEKGRILIGCRRAGKACRIEVHDTGPGIPPEAHAAIFEAFRRLKPETAPGLGLGLTS
jgi:signal transduction histidine kinase